MDSNVRVVQSYVYYKDKTFWVSSSERESSAYGASRYIETIAWELLSVKEFKRGKIVGEGSGLYDHFEMCRQLSYTGEYVEKRDEQ